jgi:hypothetical protein
MKKLLSTQFEPDPPLTEEQVQRDIHWLSYSMALRSFEKKTARLDRQAVQTKKPPLEQLWARKLSD